MLDISNIPTQSDNFRIFYTQGSTAWQTWTKPRNCKFVWMMCIGGGGGGEGASRISPGQGGGSAGVVRAIFQANVLPDTLFVQPGVGGAGGAGNTFQGTNTAGGTATKCFVSIVPSAASTMNIVCTSGNGAAAGTTAETIATTANAGLLSLGNFQATAGTAGGGVDVTPLVSTITTPGTAGGNSVNNTRAILSVNIGTTVTPLLTGSAPDTIEGSSGYWNWKPMYGLGAIGGRGTTGAVAYKGNNAIAYGCGGGGGGTGDITALNVAIGGDGGKGGDGLVIIATF